MALAPWYRRSEVLCLAIEQTTHHLHTEIDRVEVEGGFVYCWAGKHRVTLRETWPSCDSEAAIAAGVQARIGHTPAYVEIVETEVIPRSASSRNVLAATPMSAPRRALSWTLKRAIRWLDRA